GRAEQRLAERRARCHSRHEKTDCGNAHGQRPAIIRVQRWPGPVVPLAYERRPSMNKKYLTIAAVVATLAPVAAPFALAQRMRGGPHGGPGELGGVMFLGHLQHAKQALGLSDQQVSDIETIFKDLHTHNAQYRESLHGSMEQVATALIN